MQRNPYPQRPVSGRNPAGRPQNVPPRGSTARPRSNTRRADSASPRGRSSVSELHRSPNAPRSGRPASRPPARRPAAAHSAPRTPSHGARRNPPPRRRRNPRIKFYLIYAAALVVLAIIAMPYIQTQMQQDTFASNVYINGMALEGYTYDQAVAYTDELAAQRLNATYTFSYQDRTWTFTPSMVGANIDYRSRLELAWNFGHVGNLFERKNTIDSLAENPVYLECQLTYDEAMLDEYIESIRAEIDVAAVNAEVIVGEAQPIFTRASETGLALNVEQFREQLVSILERGEGVTTLPVEVVFPEIDSNAASFQLIAEFSTDVSFRNSASRTNVSRALSFYNGLAVQPGVQISFNELVGARTEANGFKKATEYAGDTTTEGIGGGVCQASTTLYNALVTAGMTIIDRKPHGMTVSYTEPSLDAAVEYGSKDLVFKNETDFTIYIYTEVDREFATVKIYGSRPDYYYRLESVVLDASIKSTRKQITPDEEGIYVYFKDDPPYIQQGKDGCQSQGWVVAYDWETGEEVSRTQVSNDVYSPSVSIEYVGVHDRPTLGLTTDY